MTHQYVYQCDICKNVVELLHEGVDNIVCMQPFACLPNHVVGKGAIRAIRNKYPLANIVTVDYDPGISEVNQINGIKLMMSIARDKLGVPLQPQEFGDRERVS
jgi:desulfoferrodoxin-like iron-binding protein